MNRSMTYERYSHLYAKYLASSTFQNIMDKQIEKLSERNMHFDICCGTGDLISHTWEMFSNHLVMDQKLYIDPEVLEKNCESLQMDLFEMPINPGMKQISKQYPLKADLITCKQAINYWAMYDSLFPYIAEMLAPGGIFMLNTFAKCPEQGVTHREYIFNGVHYLEVAFTVDDTIHHWQHTACDDDITTFFFFEEAYFREVLTKAGFKHIKKIQDDNSVYYICSKDREV